MEDGMTIDSLDASTFGATDHRTWLTLVERALKGADFRQTLVSQTDDGIPVEPLYGRRDAAVLVPRQRPDRAWTVSQRIDDPDPERALVQLGDDLANGATGISVVAGTSGSAFGAGIEGDGDGLAKKLQAAIAGKGISLRLDGCPASLQDAIASAFSGTGAAQTVHFGLDGFGPPHGIAGLVDDFRRLSGHGFKGTVLNADGRPVHNAGGTAAQELAVMAAALVGHLRRLGDDGVQPDAVLNATSLCLCADQTQFLTSAKARAARLIFARIAEACGTPASPAHLFMETSYRMLSRLDPDTNVLRNAIAVFAAGVGGADEISVLPHTLVHGIPDPLARRLARNTQTVLIAESHLDHVTDPAAGTGGVEALTDALAEKAWDIFTGIERERGLSAVIAGGKLAAMVAEARATRAKKPIVGTTLFALKEERPVTVLGALEPVGTVMGLRPVRTDEEVEG
jgi:methylmalonyl-CoA mutase